MKKTISHKTPAALMTAFLILTTSFLQGCSGPAENTPPDSAANLPAICNTLDSAIIADVLETENYTTEPMDDLASDVEGCKYMATGDAVPVKTFNFIRREEKTPAIAKDSYYKAVNVWQNSQMDNRELSYEQNIGDETFWAYGEKTPQLVTYKDNILLIITFGNLKKPNAEMLTKAKTIAPPLLLQK